MGETVLMRTDRCYCDECNDLFSSGDYVGKYGTSADEYYCADCILAYLLAAGFVCVPC